MVKFLKSLTNIIIVSVTILSLIATLFKKLDPFSALIVLGILLLLGFVSLIIYQIAKLENKISIIEQKFKRADELTDIRKDIEALKLVILKRK